MVIKMKFSKQNLPAVRADIAAALAAVEKKYGIQLSVGNIRFTDNDFKAQLVAVTNDAASAVAPEGVKLTAGVIKWQKSFKEYAGIWGLKATDLGAEISVGGKKYKIIGARPKATNKIVLGDCSDKYTAISTEQVKNLLNSARA